jgi:hypothetical protein
MTGWAATYYNYLALNRLTSAARAAGRGLTEGQLRPVVSLPPVVQADVVAFAVKRSLNGKEVTVLAQVAREGDRNRLQARLATLDGPARGGGRTSVSWAWLLHAVPQDVEQRCRALAAELQACPPDARRKRVAAMREQRERLVALTRYFDHLIEQFGEPGEPEAVRVLG